MCRSRAWPLVHRLTIRPSGRACRTPLSSGVRAQPVANPISKRIAKGTIGELLVQTRLLQYGAQATAPIKDSGNDLIALKDYAVKTI